MDRPQMLAPPLGPFSQHGAFAAAMTMALERSAL